MDLEAVRPLLRGLDREQRAAVTHRSGPLLVLAGPGTGKTEVITRRIAWLIATRRAQPSEILALTFTEKAADEMQARVDLLVPYGRADAAIHTFHAFGDRLLRDHVHELGLPLMPRVISHAEAVMLLREHLFELGLERYRPLADPTRFLDALVDLFGRAKDEGVDPAAYGAYASELAAGAEAVAAAATSDGERAAARALLDEAAGQAELATAYSRYSALLTAHGLIDFGDQVWLALRLLRERPAVGAAVRRRFRYVLVDECQDTDPVQMDLVRELGRHGEVTLVGDDDQAIYTFRGAAVENLRDLHAAFPALRRIVLRRNYRSRGPILVAAHRLIAHNDPHRLASQGGLDKPLLPHRRAGRAAPVRQLAFATATEEADAIAADIASRIEAGIAPRDIAVLARTNADLVTIGRSLDPRGVPWRGGGTTSLTGHRDVRDTLAFLRAVVEPDGGTDLYAVATGDPYRMGGSDLTAILEMARRRHRSLWSLSRELLEQPGLLRLGQATRDALERLVGDMSAAISASHERSTAEVLYGHLRRSGRYAALVAAAERGDEGPLRRLARLFELLREHGSLLDDARPPVLVPHLAALLGSGEDPAADDGDPEEDAVAVLTVHRAKGLEFSVVFVVGLAEGRFPARGRRERLPLPDPLRRGADTPEAPWAEERRLAYVALTRARDELVLTFATRSADGGRRRRPSPFVAEALDAPPLDAHGVATLAELEAAIAGPRVAGPAGGVAPAAASEGGPLSLSYSQVDDFLACPLRHHLRHRLRVPTPPHHALVVGSALHQAAAAYHGTRMRGRVPTEAEVLQVLAAHWSSEGFLSRHHEDARYAAAEAALLRLMATPLDPERTTIGVERPFAVQLGADTVRGRYDRVDRAPEGTIITDYKSSDVRDGRQATERARDSLQLQLYTLAWQAETGELPVAVELHFLDSGLVGRVAPDRARLAKARAVLETAAAGIRDGRAEAHPDRFGCGSCPYREICPSSAA